jgi:hypothetical protein
MGRVVRLLCIGAGSVSLGLGIVGVFLPLLPTTPFLLLAAFCYARGSKRFYFMLLNHPRLGPFITNYKERRGIPRRTKMVALSVLWISISVSAVFVVPPGLWTVVLFAIAVGVTIHLIIFPTLPGSSDNAQGDGNGPGSAGGCSRPA